MKEMLVIEKESNKSILKPRGRFRIKLYPLSDEWKSKLTLTSNKSIAPKLTNLMTILTQDPNLNELLSLNEFAQRVELSKSPPWDNGRSRILTDDDMMKLKVYLAETFDSEFSKDNLYTAVTAVASINKHHPIKKMIENTEWDGVPRAEAMFIDYLGAHDNLYTKAVAKTWLTGAVKRIYEPSCKFELVPVLQGGQGRGKSTLAKVLGGEWFTDGLNDMQSKDSRDFLRGAWIIELSELSAMKKTDVEVVKQFISSTVDRYRPAYGRLTQEFPRTAVFIATTNDSGYLKDLTGSRRFAPIMIDEGNRRLDVFNVEHESIQQIWAEAYTWYKKNHPIYLSQDIEKMADVYREQAQDESPIKDIVVQYLNVGLPSDWSDYSTMRRREYITDVMENSKNQKNDYVRDKITTREILIELFNRNPQDELRGDGEAKKIAMILNNLDGWKTTTFRVKGQVMKGYKRV